MIRFRWRIFFKIFARVNVYVINTRSLALASLRFALAAPRGDSGRTKGGSFLHDEAATYPRYERDAKYYQRRMAATEVGFGTTFSAAGLNNENSSRAPTRHFIPPRIIAGAVHEASPERRTHKKCSCK
jgi:hypothetical protein